MEFNNPALIIGVGRRGIEPPKPSEHLIVEVVIMDKSNGVLQPLLYQPHSHIDPAESNYSSAEYRNLIPIDDQSFALIGEVLSIDKSKKIIYLSNNISVSYKYLIIASGIKPTILGSTHDEELTPGIHALIDAIRVRNNIAHSLKFPDAAHMGFNNRKKTHAELKSPEDDHLQTILKLLNPYSVVSTKSLDMTISGTEKRLYQVEL